MINVISRHRGAINSELSEIYKVIIRIGSNDIAKGVPPGKIVNSREN